MSLEKFIELAHINPRSLQPPTCLKAEWRWLDVLSQGVEMPDGSLVDPMDPEIILAQPVVMTLSYTRTHELEQGLREELPYLSQNIYSDHVVFLKNPRRLRDLEGVSSVDLGTTNGITLVDGQVFLVSPGGNLTRPWIEDSGLIYQFFAHLLQRDRRTFPQSPAYISSTQ